MTLTLVVSGLLWPRQVMQDTLYDIELPALQTLLGKGRRLVGGPPSAEAWWSAYFGIDLADFAAAPLRLAAAGREAGDAMWLCADPVHLEMTQRGAMLKDPTRLDIDAEEAAQLSAALAPLFAEVGELSATTPASWHLRLRVAPPAMPTRLYDLIEQSGMSLMPMGHEDRHWRRLINEVQMCLHAHPVNTARAAQGRLEINAIALWGAGRKPAPSVKASSMLQCDDPVIAGAGKLAGLAVMPLPPRHEHSTTDCLVHWHRLLGAAYGHDALAWRDGLRELDDWLAPALAALSSGKLDRIQLHGFGEETTLSVSMASLDRYRFWRKPRRLESL